MRQHLSKKEQQARKKRVEFSICYRFPPQKPEDLDMIAHRFDEIWKWVDKRLVSGQAKVQIIYGRKKVPVGIRIHARFVEDPRDYQSLAQLLESVSKTFARLMRYQGGDRPKPHDQISFLDSFVEARTDLEPIPHHPDDPRILI